MRGKSWSGAGKSLSSMHKINLETRTRGRGCYSEGNEGSGSTEADSAQAVISWGEIKNGGRKKGLTMIGRHCR